MEERDKKEMKTLGLIIAIWIIWTTVSIILGFGYGIDVNPLFSNKGEALFNCIVLIIAIGINYLYFKNKKDEKR